MPAAQYPGKSGTGDQGTEPAPGGPVSFLSGSLGALVELHHGPLLLHRLDGPRPQSAYLVDGVRPGQAPGLHQVAGQHGARAPVAMHAVHRHALTGGRGGNACFQHRDVNL